MKLSYRDKVIFICAIVAIILIAGFFLFIKPKYDEMTVAKTFLQSKETEKQGIEDRINTLPTLVEQVKETAKQIDEVPGRFVVYQEPYLTEQLIYEVLEECDVDVRAMHTAYVMPGSVQNYTVGRKNIYTYDFLMQGDLYEELPQKVRDAYNNAPGTPTQVQVIGTTEVIVSYNDEAELESVIRFMDTIAEDERTIRVLNYSRNYDEEAPEGGVAGTINMEVYSIFPLNVEKVMEESDQVEIVPAETAE